MAAPSAESDCIFCKIIAGTIPCYKLYEDEKIISFLDAFPITEGHVLVVPKHHYLSFSEVPDDVGAEWFKVTNKLAKAVSKLDGVKAYNLFQASGKEADQTVFHAHLHILPRRTDDKLFGAALKNGPFIDKEIGTRLQAAIKTSL